MAGASQAALSCGLPEAQPTWIDFADGSVSFWQERFARPGVVVATGGPDLAAGARAAGAGTVHWDMYLRKRVGTPSEPADRGAHREASRLALRLRRDSVSGCQTPLARAQRAVGGLAPDAADADGRALPRQRPPLRDAPSRARRAPGAPRLERAVHGWRRGDVVEVGGGGLRSRPRELRECEPHLAGGSGRRLASAARSPSSVRGEAPRARDSARAHRDHDRLPDRCRMRADARVSGRGHAGSASRSGTRSR